MQICGRLRLTCWMFRISWNLISGRSPASGLIQSPQLLCPQETLNRKCFVFFFGNLKKIWFLFFGIAWFLMEYSVVLFGFKFNVLLVFLHFLLWLKKREKKLRKGWNMSSSVSPCPVDVHPPHTIRAKTPINTDPHLRYHTNGNLIEIYQYYGTPTTVLHRLVKSTQSVKGFASFFRFLSSVEPLWTSLSLFELAIPWVISH